MTNQDPLLMDELGADDHENPQVRRRVLEVEFRFPATAIVRLECGHKARIANVRGWSCTLTPDGLDLGNWSCDRCPKGEGERR